MLHMEETKTCATCKNAKPVSQFYRIAKGMKGYRPHCKPCHAVKRRSAYLKAGGKDVPYAQLIRREYGITLDEYNTQLRTQAGRCAVCRRPETITTKAGQPRRLAVDHDHATGALRGLLCHRCNILVWAFEENHAVLDLIKGYVDTFQRSYAGR